LRIHDLRHGVATRLLRAGAHDRKIMRMMGWKTVQMIRRYGHLVDEDTADLAALLEPSATESATERFRG